MQRRRSSRAISFGRQRCSMRWDTRRPPPTREYGQPRRSPRKGSSVRPGRSSHVRSPFIARSVLPRICSKAKSLYGAQSRGAERLRSGDVANRGGASWWDRVPRRVSGRPLRILVVAAKPEGRVGFVATLGGTVEDRVIPHQKLQPTGCGGVGVEYGTLVPNEGAETRALRQVADNVRSGGAREVV